MVDLHERENIKIIKSEKKNVSDEEMEAFRKQLNLYSDGIDSFCKYYIDKQAESKYEMSASEFDALINKLIKQHKIFKSLLKEQEG